MFYSIKNTKIYSIYKIMDDKYIVIIDAEDKKNQIKYFSITNSKSAIKEKVFKYIKNIFSVF
jgi:hypothetical protein